jgi:hypothetical protein
MTDIVQRPTAEVHARSRPWAVLWMWAWDTAVSFVATLPAVALVRAAYGRHPEGDAPLWAPGALPLLGLLAREGNGIRASTTTASFMLFFAAIAGLIPLAALMISISSAGTDGRAPRGSRVLEAALRTFRPFGLLLLGFGIVEGLVLTTGFLVGIGVQSWTQQWLGEALAQELAVAAGALAFIGTMVLGVLHDLARAVVIRHDVGVGPAVVLGARTLRRAPISVAWSWAWRAVIGLAPIVAVGALANGIGGRGGMALLVLGVLHQCVVMSRVALRASWLAKAMRTCDRVETSEALFAMRPLEEGAHLEMSER